KWASPRRRPGRRSGRISVTTWERVAPRANRSTSSPDPESLLRGRDRRAPHPHAETRSPEKTRENDGARDYRLAARRGETQPQRPRTRDLRPPVGHHPGADP